jgi:hypothetical protein
MAKVNDEYGFTQLTKLNITDKFLIRGQPVATDGPFLKTEEPAEQTVLGPVTFLSSITVPPGSVQLGQLNLSSGGQYLVTESPVTGTSAFVVSREFDSAGSKPLISEKLGSFQQLDLGNFTGDQETTNFATGVGSSSPGVNGYQFETRSRFYTDVVGLNLTIRLNDEFGPIVAQVTNFTKTGVNPAGEIVAIPLDNPYLVNPSTTYYAEYSSDTAWTWDGDSTVVPGQFTPYFEVWGYPIDAIETIATDVTGNLVVSISNSLLNASFQAKGRFDLDTTRDNLEDVFCYITKGTAISGTTEVRIVYSNANDNADPRNGEIYFSGTLNSSSSSEHRLELTPTATPIPAQAATFFQIQAKEFGAGFTYLDGVTVFYGEI